MICAHHATEKLEEVKSSVLDCCIPSGKAGNQLSDLGTSLYHFLWSSFPTANFSYCSQFLLYFQSQLVKDELSDRGSLCILLHGTAESCRKQHFLWKCLQVKSNLSPYSDWLMRFLRLSLQGIVSNSWSSASAALCNFLCTLKLIFVGHRMPVPVVLKLLNQTGPVDLRMCIPYSTSSLY